MLHSVDQCVPKSNRHGLQEVQSRSCDEHGADVVHDFRDILRRRSSIRGQVRRARRTPRGGWVPLPGTDVRWGNPPPTACGYTWSGKHCPGSDDNPPTTRSPRRCTPRLQSRRPPLLSSAPSPSATAATAPRHPRDCWLSS